MLGREVSAETYGRMEQQLRDARMLDLTGADFARLSDAGIAELRNIPGISDALGVFLTEQLKQMTRALDELQSLCPSAHFVTVGDEIEMSSRAAATEAQAKLNHLQEGLRDAAAAAAAAPIETAALDARDTARLEFIAVSQALSTALAEQWASQFSAVTSATEAWRRLQAEAHHLSIQAAECQRVIEAAEPGRSKTMLEELQLTDKGCRQEVASCQARIVIIKGEASPSPRRDDDGGLERRIETSPAVKEARYLRQDCQIRSFFIQRADLQTDFTTDTLRIGITSNVWNGQARSRCTADEWMV
jgi:hypothetical protein